MPIVFNPAPTAANPIVPDWVQAEDDGSIGYANYTQASYAPVVIQANGTIGDGPYGAAGQSGDFDMFIVDVNSAPGPPPQGIIVDVDAQVLGSSLDAVIEIYNAAGTLVASNDNDPYGGLDPYLVFNAAPDGTYYVVIRGASSLLGDPSDSASGNGTGSVGAYRVFIANDQDVARIRHGDDLGGSVNGTFQSDILVGNGGGDLLDGGDSNDLFVWNAGDGSDTVDGGGDYDVQEVNASNNSETFHLYTFYTGMFVTFHSILDINGGPGGNFGLGLHNLEAVDLRARGGNDTFAIGPIPAPRSLSDLIRFWGGNGVDTLSAITALNAIAAWGEAGNDVLRSGLGADSLQGGATLAGGRGKDLLTGGTGRDTYDFNAVNESTAAASGRDTVSGFKRSQGDRVDLRTLDADQRAANPGNDVFTFIGAQGFAAYHAAHPTVFGMARFANGLLQVNVNANMAADFSVALPGVMAMVGGDLFL